MKKVLFVLILLSTSAAFGQYTGASTRSSEPVILSAPSHPAQAIYSSMSSERNILASANFTSAQGERPASDFPQPEIMSLGAAARELRRQHETAKKSQVVWVNQ